jgi:hypothetical protein
VAIAVGNEDNYQAAVDGLGRGAVECEHAEEALAAGLGPPLHLGARVQGPGRGLRPEHGLLLGLVGLLVAQDVVLGDGGLGLLVHRGLGIRQRTLALAGFAAHPSSQGGHQPGRARNSCSSSQLADPGVDGQCLQPAELGTCNLRHHHGYHFRLAANRRASQKKTVTESRGTVEITTNEMMYSTVVNSASLSAFDEVGTEHTRYIVEIIEQNGAK